MALSKEEWTRRLSVIDQKIADVRNLVFSRANGKAAPVGLEGARYEFPMTQQQLNDTTRDLIQAARDAKDELTNAIQAEIA